MELLTSLPVIDRARDDPDIVSNVYIEIEIFEVTFSFITSWSIKYIVLCSNLLNF